jgi:hypothetical protein
VVRKVRFHGRHLPDSSRHAASPVASGFWRTGSRWRHFAQASYADDMVYDGLEFHFDHVTGDELVLIFRDSADGVVETSIGRSRAVR